MSSWQLIDVHGTALIVQSQDADARWVESQEKATELTESRWPLSVDRHSLLHASYILTAHHVS
jgi:hypothetical protein